MQKQIYLHFAEAKFKHREVFVAQVYSQRGFILSVVAKKHLYVFVEAT